MKSISLSIFIILIVFIYGCAGTARNAYTNNETSKLHKNSAKVYIHPGETKQVDILQAFGKPDSVIQKQDEVIWSYDKKADVVKNSDVYSTVYFYDDAGSSDNISSSKPVKLIIIFNNSQIVKDYSLQFPNLR
jgi:hypothetical protein